MAKRFLITGGAGCIGSAVVRRLIAGEPNLGTGAAKAGKTQYARRLLENLR
jgi:nucleoside-diphosphate-sugar epimerase